MMNRPPREARALSWPLLSYDDLIYVHPDGKKIVYGDVVIVAEGQSARFSAGGEYYWFREPQRYTIGYDDRTESEILRGNLMGEDLDGLPLLVNTDLTFCCIKPLSEYPIKSESYLMINRMVGINPEFKVRLTVTDDEQLLRSIAPGSRAIDQVLSSLNKQIRQRLQDTLYPLFNDFSSAEDIRLQLGDAQWCNEFLSELRTAVARQAEFGITVEQLELVGWNVWSGFCEECGAPIRPRAGRCPNMHRIRRCPVCNDPVYGGLCLTHGHDILFCPICNRYVVPQDGHCRTHPEIKRTGSTSVY